jgi:fumarate reductase subunit C
VSVRDEVRLWLLQRTTAAVLALCVLVHLATLIYAVRGGLGAAEILARTRGHVGWAAFYAVFVVAAAIHGGIGLRTIGAEWFGWRRGAGTGTALLFAATVLLLGFRAVWAVFSA